MSLTSVGVDLSTLALFTGALGVGVGLGLQRTASNLFSGIVLLLDKSIKPGDVIEVGGTYGWVSSLGARYVSVETRDGTEFLIPNEDIITHQVLNWSHKSDRVRLKLPVRVPHDSDLDQVLALMKEAAGIWNGCCGAAAKPPGHGFRRERDRTRTSLLDRGCAERGPEHQKRSALSNMAAVPAGGIQSPIPNGRLCA